MKKETKESKKDITLRDIYKMYNSDKRKFIDTIINSGEQCILRAGSLTVPVYMEEYTEEESPDEKFYFFTVTPEVLEEDIVDLKIFNEFISDMLFSVSDFSVSVNSENLIEIVLNPKHWKELLTELLEDVRERQVLYANVCELTLNPFHQFNFNTIELE